MAPLRNAYFNLLQAICFGTNFNCMFNRSSIAAEQDSAEENVLKHLREFYNERDSSGVVKESLKWKTLFYNRQVIYLSVSVRSDRSWNSWKSFRPVNNQENTVASNRSELFIGKSSGCRRHKSPVLQFFPHPNDEGPSRWTCWNCSLCVLRRL